MKGSANRAGRAGQAHLAADFRQPRIGIDESPDAGGIDVRHASQIEYQIFMAGRDQFRNNRRQFLRLPQEQLSTKRHNGGGGLNVAKLEFQGQRKVYRIG